MPGKKNKKVEKELIPEETVPVGSETSDHDYDAELKDAEVMREEELEGHLPSEDDIPPANVDKMWRYLSPKKVVAADISLILRFHVLLDALKGYGISQNLFQELPKDMRTLFHDELLPSEQWIPGENL